MRKYLTSIIAVVAMLFSSAAMSAMTLQGGEGGLNLTIVIGDNPNPPKENEEGRRTSSSLIATISYSGVSIPGVEKGEILTYEAYDEAGECMAIFSDEESFIDYFFSTEGIAMVKFTTASYIYTGWL